MIVIASICAALSIANAIAAIVYGIRSQPISLFFTLNFFVLGALVQLGTFG